MKNLSAIQTKNLKLIKVFLLVTGLVILAKTTNNILTPQSPKSITMVQTQVK